MYRIINVVDGNEYIMHDQRDKNLTAIDPRLVLTLNKTGTLEFSIPSEHRHYNTLKKLKSSIRLIEDGVLIYEGRIISDETDFYNTRSVICEGSLAYFQDSMQRPFLVSGKSTREFLEQLIESHNSQVEERKRFTLGQIIVVDEDGERDRENKGITNTWNVMKTHLLESPGGYLWVSYQGDKKLLNYTWDYGGYNEQEIRFGMNLLDLSKYQDATNIFTRVIPSGAEVEYKDELGKKQTKTIDITSVNGGKDYLDADESAIEEFGIITATLNWPNIADPERLKAKTAAYLKESIQIPETLKISAVDLNYAGVDIGRFKVGKYTKVISRQHHLEKELLLAQLDLHLDNPQKGSISLGGTQPTFTGSVVNQQANISKTVQKVAESASAEINRKVENATNLITGDLGGYVVLDNTDPVTGETMHPWRILVMNTPDKNTAKNVIQINQNGLGFSTTGINGPYRNAWTIDGNLVADFITAGTMLADRIRGGTYEVGGAGLGRDGSIVVMDAAGKTIGSWDKTGLTILKGILQGVSAVFGGVDNQNGAIEVKNASGRTIGRWDKDGLYMQNGTIDVGPLYADADQVSFGDFYVSTDGANIMRSNDGSVAIQTDAGGPFGSYTVIKLKSESGETILSDHHLDIVTMFCRGISKRYGWSSKWDDVAASINWCFEEIEKLKAIVENL